MLKTHVEFFDAGIKFHMTFENDVEFFILCLTFHITFKKLRKTIEIQKMNLYCAVRVPKQKEEDRHENDRFF